MGQKKILRINVLSGLEVSGMDTNDFIEPSNVLTQKITPVSKLNIPRQEDVATRVGWLMTGCSVVTINRISMEYLEEMPIKQYNLSVSGWCSLGIH